MSSSKGEITRQKILRVIDDFISRHRYPPSVQDVQRFLGMRSFDAVGRHLKVLREQGLVDWEDNTGQRIILTDKTPMAEYLREKYN